MDRGRLPYRGGKASLLGSLTTGGTMLPPKQWLMEKPGRQWRNSVLLGQVADRQ